MQVHGEIIQINEEGEQVVAVAGHEPIVLRVNQNAVAGGYVGCNVRLERSDVRSMWVCHGLAVASTPEQAGWKVDEPPHVDEDADSVSENETPEGIDEPAQ